MRISTEDSDSPLVEQVRFLPTGWESLDDEELLALFSKLREGLVVGTTRTARATGPKPPAVRKQKGFIIRDESLLAKLEEEPVNDVASGSVDSE